MSAHMGALASSDGNGGPEARGRKPHLAAVRPRNASGRFARQAVNASVQRANPMRKVSSNRVTQVERLPENRPRRRKRTLAHEQSASSKRPRSSSSANDNDSDDDDDDAARPARLKEGDESTEGDRGDFGGGSGGGGGPEGGADAEDECRCAAPSTDERDRAAYKRAVRALGAAVWGLPYRARRALLFAWGLSDYCYALLTDRNGRNATRKFKPHRQKPAFLAEVAAWHAQVPWRWRAAVDWTLGEPAAARVYERIGRVDVGGPPNVTPHRVAVNTLTRALLATGAAAGAQLAANGAPTTRELESLVKQVKERCRAMRNTHGKATIIPVATARVVAGAPMPDAAPGYLGGAARNAAIRTTAPRIVVGRQGKAAAPSAGDAEPEVCYVPASPPSAFAFVTERGGSTPAEGGASALSPSLHAAFAGLQAPLSPRPCFFDVDAPIGGDERPGDVDAATDIGGLLGPLSHPFGSGNAPVWHSHGEEAPLWRRPSGNAPVFRHHSGGNWSECLVPGTAEPRRNSHDASGAAAIADDVWPLSCPGCDGSADFAFCPLSPPRLVRSSRVTSSIVPAHDGTLASFARLPLHIVLPASLRPRSCAGFLPLSPLSS